MAILIQPVRLLRAIRDVDLQRDWQVAQREGLLEQRLLLDPDDPQRGMLWTRWDSLDRARGFRAETGRSAPAPAEKSAGVLGPIRQLFGKSTRPSPPSAPIAGGALEPVEDAKLYVHQEPPAR